MINTDNNPYWRILPNNNFLVCLACNTVYSNARTTNWFWMVPLHAYNLPGPTRVRPATIDPDVSRPSSSCIHFSIGHRTNGLSVPTTITPCVFVRVCCKFAFATHACHWHHVHDMTVSRLPCTGFIHVHAVIKGEYRFIMFIINTRHGTLAVWCCRFPFFSLPNFVHSFHETVRRVRFMLSALITGNSG